MSTKIDIRGIDKVKLLEKLWTNQKQAGFFAMYGEMVPGFNALEATEAVKDSIDYFCGRAIKCNLSRDTTDPWGYDRDAPEGEGSFQSIVDQFKMGG
jgi:hypothetical protein